MVTLELPEDKLRAVNLVIEQRAWGAFTMEFYPTYDFIPVVSKKLEQEKKINLKG